jgi:hypothetical protein
MTTTIDDRTTTRPVPDRADASRPARGRALWVACGSVLLVAALAWGTFSVVELLAHEERTERFVVPAAGLTRLDVDNDAGSVRIVGTDGDEISVEADVSVGVRDTGFSHEVVDSTLQLSGSCPIIGSRWCGVSYRIEVPRRLDIEVTSDDGRVDVRNIDGGVVIDSDEGRVDVRNVDGDVVIDSDDGRVELIDVAGTIEVDGNNGRIVGRDLSGTVVDVSTDNGGIDLEFTAAPDRVRANGDNGSIDIAVPRIDEGYSVIADTENDESNVEVDDNPESPHIIAVETDNGSITVRYE